MEPCVGIPSSLSSPDSWNPLGLGLGLDNATGWNDLSSRRSTSRRRVGIVQQQQQATLRCLERNPRNPKSCGNRSAFAVVRASLSREQLEGDKGLSSVKDYNSAILSCVRYACFFHFCHLEISID